MPVPPWSQNQQRANFPIPPRNIGLLNPPLSQRNLQVANPIALIPPGLMNSPVGQLGNLGGKGILDNAGRSGIIGNSPKQLGLPRPSILGNSPRPLSNQRQGLLADSPRPLSNHRQGLLSDSPRPLLGNIRGDGRPGILNNRTQDVNVRSGISNRDRNGPVQQNQGFSPKQHGSPQGQNRNSPNTRNRNKVEAINKELEEKALKAELSKEFFDRIKPLSNTQVANFVALEFAQKQIAAANNVPFTGKTTGIGHYMCNICKINHLSYQKLQTHYKSSEHKELEDLFNLKKEQVRLIMNNTITGPTASKTPSAEMIAISRAEVEMKLKPTVIDLDAYILGVYESIMKPYWPVPKSNYYCRTCNYTEFRNERELNNHKSTKDHQKMEDSYEKSFCLYCQVHTGDEKKMVSHEKDSQHIKIKDLMEKTKQCAIDHWHKVNKKDVPKKYAEESKEDEKEQKEEVNKADPKIGSKRSAPNDEKGYSSPTKKVTTAKEAPKEANNTKSSSSSNLNKSSSSSSANKNSSSSSLNKTSSSSSLNKSSSSSSLNKSASSSSLNKTQSSKETVPDGKRDEISDSDKIWFAPIFGFMCKACHKFLANSTEQKVHIKDPAHSAAIVKFKKSITG